MSDNDIEKQIKTIDGKLYALLIKRTELVKKNPYPLKIENILGYEAKEIRQMLKSHKGDFPEYVLAKILREILSASANLTEKIKIAAYGDEKDIVLLNYIQEHFGSYIDVFMLSSYSQVFNMVSTHETDLAIVPSDNHEMNIKPWWNTLLADKKKESLNIVAKLPFILSSNNIPENEMYVLALSPADASGIDNSIFAIETEVDVSHSTIIETLAELGFSEAKIAATTNFEETKYSLVEVKGFVKAETMHKMEKPKVFKNLQLAGTYAKSIAL